MSTPCQAPFVLQKEMSRMVQDILENGVIGELASPWASSVVMVNKADGTLHFCLDYWKVNTLTK